MADPLTREGDGILGSDEIFSRSKVAPQGEERFKASPRTPCLILNRRPGLTRQL